MNAGRIVLPPPVHTFADSNTSLERERRVAKLLGFDFELANSLFAGDDGSPQQAARLLLNNIAGYPRGTRGGTAIEYGRRFVAGSGGSWYIDSDHLEGNLPEHRSAIEHADLLHAAGFAEAQRALQACQRQLPRGATVNLLANCSDGNTAWGSHLSVLVTRECFDNLLSRKPHQAGFLATHLVSSVPFTGQGMVGAGNGREACKFQFSQRADWFERFCGQQTMVDRPLINLRDEPHASGNLARLHLIFPDMVLCPVANILKAGTVQLVVAMIEAGWTDPNLCLDDPLAAASQISRDLDLRQRYRTTVRGRSLSVLEIQSSLAALAGEFIDSGAADGVVPDAELVLQLWQETLEMLAAKEAEGLAGRCDAWLKYLLLDRQRCRRNLSWAAGEMRVADSLFASLNRQNSLFYHAVDNGLVERMPTPEKIERGRCQPPDDTRAYFRAHLLRRFGACVAEIDWSRIRLRMPTLRHWTAYAEIGLENPLGFGRDQTQHLFDECEDIESLVASVNELAHRSAQWRPAMSLPR